MLKKQIVRDSDDNSFFAVAGSTGDRVIRLSQSQEGGVLFKTEVYKLSGSRIFGLQIDCMNSNAIYIIDNNRKVHHIAEKGAEFYADRITELAASIPNNNRDWFSAQVSPNRPPHCKGSTTLRCFAAI